MHNDCCLPLTQSLHYWYPVQHCKVLRATLGMCYIKPNYSKSYLIQRDWWWGRGEGRFKNVISHLFSTSKNTWSLRAQFRHSLVINSPTDFSGGCMKASALLATGGGRIGSYRGCSWEGKYARSRWGRARPFLNSMYGCFTVKTGKQKHASYLTKNKGTLKLVKDNIFIWMIWQSCHRSVTCYKESLRIITFIRPVTLSFSHTFLTSVPLQRQFSFLK